MGSFGGAEQDVVTDHPKSLESAFCSGINHARNAQAAGRRECCLPDFFEKLAAVANCDRTCQAGRLATHVGGALDVVLAAQRIHASTGFAEIAGKQCEVDEARDRLGALYMLGHSQAMETD